MEMPGRNLSSDKYRYGFNGKENDNEVKGEGNQQDYGMRIYDPRIARFLSTDPIGNEFPWNSSYAFAENDPINFIDLDGLEKASPGAYDKAQQLKSIIYNRIISNRTKLSTVTDVEVIKTIELSIALDKQTYAALVVFVYQNNPSDAERIAYYLDKSRPAVEEALDLSPAGDVKVIFTGKNFKGETQSRLGAVGWLALDVFGGEILSGAAKTKKFIQKFDGKTREALEKIIQKVEKHSESLDELHLRAAVNDIFGKPVVINGKTFNHLKDVKDNLNGLVKEIKKLNKIIGERKNSKEVIEAATDLRNVLTKQKDEIQSVLKRAEKSAKKK